ncbi:MAG: outer membrane beta-barrel family protein, partial [Bacteroidota bacterium]
EESQLLRQANLYYQHGWLRGGVKYDLVDFDTRQEVTLAELTETAFVADLRKGGYFLEAEQKWNDWSLYAGLRYEAYRARTQVQETVGTNGYRGFFPSLSLTYAPSEASWQVTYSRRLDRPGFFDLVPLVTYNSPVARETGNPFLLPEINDRWELTCRRSTDRLALSGTAFYDGKDNLIQTVISQPTPEILLLRPENQGSRTAWGVEGSVELNGAWWSTQLTGNASRSRFLRDNVRGGTSRLRLRQEFSLLRAWTVQLIGLLRGRSQTLWQTQRGYLTTDLVLTKRFGEGGGTLTLRAQDIFDQRIYEYTVVQDGLRETQTYKWQTRRLSLNLRWPLTL